MLELCRNLAAKSRLGVLNGSVNRRHIAIEANPSLLDRLLQGHLNVEEGALQLEYKALKVGLVGVVLDGLTRLTKSLTFPIKLAERVLLLLKVILDLADGFFLGCALRCVHLFFAEGNEALLVSVLVLDNGLELSDMLFNRTLRVRIDLCHSLEASEFFVIIKGLAT